MVPEGNLSEFSLPDLLQIISMEAGTGTLRLSAPGRQGSLEADGGVLVGASCGPKAGEEAVYALFLWEDGVFRWEAGAVGALGRNVNVSLGDLTREGIARRDMWRLAKQTLPSLDAIYRRKAAGQRGEWSEGVQQAWDALGEGHTIGNLGRRLGISPAVAAHALGTLWADGALDAEIPEAEAAWMLFRRVLSALVGRFTDISGLRMTESMEAFLAEQGAAQGLELQASHGRLLDGEAPGGDPTAACASVLAAVMAYMARLHGASFVDRAVAEVARTATAAEQAAMDRLGLAVPARAEGD